jgi:hypothetical protein
MRVNTLHEAMIKVLQERPAKTATLEDVSTEIEKRDLWVRPTDGRYPEAWQIKRRANKEEYRDRFELIPPDKIRYIK